MARMGLKTKRGTMVVSVYDKAEVKDQLTSLALVKADAVIADAITKRHTQGSDTNDHSHANITTLDTYSQTEANLADAVSKKHTNTSDHTQNGDTDLDATFEASLKNTDNHTSGSTNKVYTATEQTKLAGIATGAQVNNISDANATDLTDGGATTLHTHAGGSGDMTKAVYDPNDDGVIATAQLAMAAIYLLVYPIGCIYQSVVSTSPATLFGGTWAAFGAGRVLVGLDSGDTDFDVAEEAGGAKTVQSSAQSFGGAALASHQHNAITAGTPAGTIAAISATAAGAVKIGTGASSAAAQTHTHSAPAFTGAELATHQHAAITAGTPAGTNTPGAATSVVQPYIVVYMWKRVS